MNGYGRTKSVWGGRLPRQPLTSQEGGTAGRLLIIPWPRRAFGGSGQEKNTNPDPEVVGEAVPRP
jgi:hypothetical protein